MKVYTFSEARQQLAGLLDCARREGEVEIRRRDGQAFVVRPMVRTGSPLDVPSVGKGISRKELLELVHESRRRGERIFDIATGFSSRRRPRKRAARRGGRKQS